MNESPTHRDHHSRWLPVLRGDQDVAEAWLQEAVFPLSLLHNQEQSAKANENGWGDKSIGNTQSQQFTVEQFTLMSFERRQTPAQSERQQATGRAQNQTEAEEF